jgi:hypothetical protein
MKVVAGVGGEVDQGGAQHFLCLFGQSHPLDPVLPSKCPVPDYQLPAAEPHRAFHLREANRESRSHRLTVVSVDPPNPGESKEPHAPAIF